MYALVIDDSPVQRTAITSMLRTLNIECQVAADGQEALNIMEQIGPPDLALVDWNMPGMDGLTFVREVRSRHRYADVPLIMVTTESEKVRVVTALQAGANEYIMKPFGPEVLSAKLSLLGLAT